jgi:2-oxoglutarate ferredoxin oxidoreductase subunit alpha
VTPVVPLEAATVRLCGDSGDGMQLAGAQLAHVSARMGNAVCSLPDYPAEIRAPAGTLAGVSGFQVHFSSHALATPGDTLDALLAMNPAALQANLKDLAPGGVLIVNSDAFTPAEWAKAGYTANPLEDSSLASYKLLPVPIDALTRDAVARINLTPREADRCRNFFALGLVCWLFDRSTEPISRWVKARFAANAGAAEGNLRALKAGYRFGEHAEWPLRFAVPKAPLPAGCYRHLSGNDALTLGLQTAARLASRSLVFAGTAMTPASELFQRLLEEPRDDTVAIQAEDEVAAAAMALGASFGGAIGASATSGPGLCLMSEALGLAVMTELPLVVIDVQRGGPSIGLPTKTEQSDLLQAMFGRNGECPLPVLAPQSPTDGFAVSVEAVRLACKFMTPVVILTDVFLTSGSEPWRIPADGELPAIASPALDPAAQFQPYARDAWLARPWEGPGTPGREHRVGGLEKEDGSGAVSYDPLNHETMVRLRAEKIAKIADDIPELAVDGPVSGDLLVVGWGNTYGAIATAVQRARRRGVAVAHAHLRHLNPLPRNTGDVLARYHRVLVPELNRGQLLALLRARYAINAEGLHKVQGRPFRAAEIEEAIG